MNGRHEALIWLLMMGSLPSLSEHILSELNLVRVGARSVCSILGPQDYTLEVPRAGHFSRPIFVSALRKAVHAQAWHSDLARVPRLGTLPSKSRGLEVDYSSMSMLTALWLATNKTGQLRLLVQHIVDTLPPCSADRAAASPALRPLYGH